MLKILGTWAIGFPTDTALRQVALNWLLMNSVCCAYIGMVETYACIGVVFMKTAC